MLRGTPARKRLFEVSPDGGRVRTKPGAVGIIRIKRAALDYLIKPLQEDDPVSLSCFAIHTCYQTPPGATQCRRCSDVCLGRVLPAIALCITLDDAGPAAPRRASHRGLSHQGCGAAAATYGTSGERADRYPYTLQVPLSLASQVARATYVLRPAASGQQDACVDSAGSRSLVMPTS